MAAIDRRTLLRDMLPGAVIVTAGIAITGLAIPKTAQAVPLDAAKTTGALELDDLVEKTQWRRRRRRWVCWWSRSRRRRVCGWRWV